MKIEIILFSYCFATFSLISVAQTPGCTDSEANNYNAAATQNDGSCTYSDISLNTTLKYTLAATLNETSGLLWWNEKLWTHNDGSGYPVLFEIDSSSGSILRTVTITNATNVDWEDLTQDDEYIYVGDMGNNANGNRTNLRIYRISKADIAGSDNVIADFINFSYEDQTDFTPQGANNTNFDCEAIIAFESSLYLFTRNWIDKQTNLYELPNTPGTQTAIKKGTLNVQGLITGAETVPGRRTIVLTGYNTSLSPFIYLLYDFAQTDFFGANKRKVTLNATFTQMEGIAMIRPDYFFVSNELFSVPPINTPAQFQTLDVASLLNSYFITLPITFIDLRAKESGDDVELSWQVHPSDDAASYDLERNTNTDFHFISIQKFGPGVNHYVDKSLLSDHKAVHYRLKVTDIDNRILYSQIVVIKGKLLNDIKIQAGKDQIQIFASPEKKGVIELFASDGNLKARTLVTSSITTVDIAFLARGVYFIRVRNREGGQTLRFFKQ